MKCFLFITVVLFTLMPSETLQAQPLHAQTISRVEVIDVATPYNLFFPRLPEPDPDSRSVRLQLVKSPAYWHYSIGPGFRFSAFTVYFFDQGLSRLDFECYLGSPESSGKVQKVHVMRTVFLAGGMLYVATAVAGGNGRTCDVRLVPRQHLLLASMAFVGVPIP